MHFKIISWVLCGCFDIGKRVEKFTHSSRAPLYFAVLVQNTLWSRYNEQYLCTVSKQSQRMMVLLYFKTTIYSKFWKSNLEYRHILWLCQLIQEQNLPWTDFTLQTLPASIFCPATSELSVFSFAVFQPAFYDPSSLPQFSHIQCLPRSLQKSYSTYFGV